MNAIEKALAILDLFDETQYEWRLAEIQRKLGIAKSSLHWTISILVKNGYLFREEMSPVYRLGPRLLTLADLCAEQYDLRRIALPFLKKLSNETKGTAALRIRMGTSSVAVAVVNSDQPLHVRYKPGEKLPINLGAPGKVLLAHMPFKEVISLEKKGVIKKVTPSSITDLATLARELKKIRIRGFAFSDAEAINGARAVAAPVRDRSGDVIGAVVLAFPSISLPRSKIPIMSEVVIKCARGLSEALGNKEEEVNKIQSKNH